MNVAVGDTICLKLESQIERVEFADYTIVGVRGGRQCQKSQSFMADCRKTPAIITGQTNPNILAR